MPMLELFTDFFSLSMNDHTEEQENAAVQLSGNLGCWQDYDISKPSRNIPVIKFVVYNSVADVEAKFTLNGRKDIEALQRFCEKTIELFDGNRLR